MQTKKSGYYLYCENYGSIGVKKKIEMQVDALSKSLDISLYQIKNIKTSILERIVNLLPWRSFPREYDIAIEKMMHTPIFLVFGKKHNINATSNINIPALPRTDTSSMI